MKNLTRGQIGGIIFATGLMAGLAGGYAIQAVESIRLDNVSCNTAAEQEMYEIGEDIYSYAQRFQKLGGGLEKEKEYYMINIYGWPILPTTDCMRKGYRDKKNSQK